MAPEEVKTSPMDRFVIESHVGGLVKSFERKAAARGLVIAAREA